jgi:hypothetical protein
MALGKQLQAAAQHNLHFSSSDSPAASFLIVMTASQVWSGCSTNGFCGAKTICPIVLNGNSVA